MLYFVTDNGRAHSWHVGTLVTGKVDPQKVTEVQADGDELEFIVKLFAVNFEITIPMVVTARILNWYGDIAKTIACALIYASKGP